MDKNTSAPTSSDSPSSKLDKFALFYEFVPFEQSSVGKTTGKN